MSECMQGITKVINEKNEQAAAGRVGFTGRPLKTVRLLFMHDTGDLILDDPAYAIVCILPVSCAKAALFVFTR